MQKVKGVGYFPSCCFASNGLHVRRPKKGNRILQSDSRINVVIFSVQEEAHGLY